MKSVMKLFVLTIAIVGLFFYANTSTSALIPEDKSTAAWYRGMELEKKGDKKGAIAAFTEVLHLDPKNPNGYRDRGRVKFEQGNYPGAINDLDGALFLTPTDTRSLRLRATCKSRLYNDVGALRDLDEAVSIDPTDLEVRYVRVQVLVRRENKEEMKVLIDDCNYCISKNHHVGTMYSYRSHGKRILGDIKGAFADANLAFAAGDKSIVTWTTLALGNAEIGNYTEAFKAIAEGEKVKPDTALFFLAAEIFEKRGLNQEAASLYERATRVMPKDYWSWFHLGNTRCGMGGPIAAEKAYRKALEIDPDSLVAQLNLADSLRQQKRFDEAKAMFAKVNEISPDVAKEYLALVEAKRSEDFPAFSGKYETTYDFDGKDVPATLDINYLDRGLYAVDWKCMSGEKIPGIGMRASGSVMAMAYLSQAKNLGVMITRWKNDNRFELLTGTNKKLKGHVVKRWLSSQEKAKTPTKEPPPESYEPSVVGTYSVDGQWKTKYQGTLTIAKDGEAYIAKWKLNDGREFSGPALLSGHFFASAFELNGFPIAMIYTIGANGTLRGTWASPGFKSAGIENAIRKQD